MFSSVFLGIKTLPLLSVLQIPHVAYSRLHEVPGVLIGAQGEGLIAQVFRGPVRLAVRYGTRHAIG